MFHSLLFMIHIQGPSVTLFVTMNAPTPVPDPVCTALSLSSDHQYMLSFFLVSFHWHATNVSTLLVLMLPLLLLLLLLWCKIHGTAITFARSSSDGVSKLQTDRTQSRKIDLSFFLLTDELLSLKTSARFHKTFQPAFGRILHKMCSGHNITRNFLHFFF